MTTYRVRRLVTPDEVLENAWIQVTDGGLARVRPAVTRGCPPTASGRRISVT